MGNFVSNDNATSLVTKVEERLGLRPKTWTGTHDNWNAMSAADQAKYDYVNFTDDSGVEPSTGTPVLTVNPTAEQIETFPNGTIWLETSE